MINFWEELEKIKKEHSRDEYEKKAESLLNAVLDSLKKSDSKTFKKIERISFECKKENSIWVMASSQQTWLRTQTYKSYEERNKVFEATKGILKECYGEDNLIVTDVNYFFVIL